jgi:hypothetical protein
MKVEASLGDVVDRVSILCLKEARMADATKVRNVREELGALRRSWTESGHPPMEQLGAWSGLNDVNGRLWDVEDDLREHERRGDFGERFVALARSVYQLNDQRAALKRDINLVLGSSIVEEKSYAPYGATSH